MFFYLCFLVGFVTCSSTNHVLISADVTIPVGSSVVVHSFQKNAHAFEVTNFETTVANSLKINVVKDHRYKSRGFDKDNALSCYNEHKVDEIDVEYPDICCRDKFGNYLIDCVVTGGIDKSVVVSQTSFTTSKLEFRKPELPQRWAIIDILNPIADFFSFRPIRIDKDTHPGRTASKYVLTIENVGTADVSVTSMEVKEFRTKPPSALTLSDPMEIVTWAVTGIVFAAPGLAFLVILVFLVSCIPCCIGCFVNCGYCLYQTRYRENNILPNHFKCYATYMIEHNSMLDCLTCFGCCFLCAVSQNVGMTEEEKKNFIDSAKNGVEKIRRRKKLEKSGASNRPKIFKNICSRLLKIPVTFFIFIVVFLGSYAFEQIVLVPTYGLKEMGTECYFSQLCYGAGGSSPGFWMIEAIFGTNFGTSKMESIFSSNSDDMKFYSLYEGKGVTFKKKTAFRFSYQSFQNTSSYFPSYSYSRGLGTGYLSRNIVGRYLNPSAWKSRTSVLEECLASPYSVSDCRILGGTENTARSTGDPWGPDVFRYPDSDERPVCGEKDSMLQSFWMKKPVQVCGVDMLIVLGVKLISVAVVVVVMLPCAICYEKSVLVSFLNELIFCEYKGVFGTGEGGLDEEQKKRLKGAVLHCLFDWCCGQCCMWCCVIPVVVPFGVVVLLNFPEDLYMIFISAICGLVIWSLTSVWVATVEYCVCCRWNGRVKRQYRLLKPELTEEEREAQAREARENRAGSDEEEGEEKGEGEEGSSEGEGEEGEGEGDDKRNSKKRRRPPKKKRPNSDDEDEEVEEEAVGSPDIEMKPISTFVNSSDEEEENDKDSDEEEEKEREEERKRKKEKIRQRKEENERREKEEREKEEKEAQEREEAEREAEEQEREARETKEREKEERERKLREKQASFRKRKEALIKAVMSEEEESEEEPPFDDEAEDVPPPPPPPPGLGSQSKDSPGPPGPPDMGASNRDSTISGLDMDLDMDEFSLDIGPGGKITKSHSMSESPDRPRTIVTKAKLDDMNIDLDSDEEERLNGGNDERVIVDLDDMEDGISSDDEDMYESQGRMTKAALRAYAESSSDEEEEERKRKKSEKKRKKAEKKERKRKEKEKKEREKKEREEREKKEREEERKRKEEERKKKEENPASVNDLFSLEFDDSDLLVEGSVDVDLGLGITLDDVNDINVEELEDSLLAEDSPSLADLIGTPVETKTMSDFEMLLQEESQPKSRSPEKKKEGRAGQVRRERYRVESLDFDEAKEKRKTRNLGRMMQGLDFDALAQEEDERKARNGKLEMLKRKSRSRNTIGSVKRRLNMMDDSSESSSDEDDIPRRKKSKRKKKGRTLK